MRWIAWVLIVLGTLALAGCQWAAWKDGHPSPDIHVSWGAKAACVG